MPYKSLAQERFFHSKRAKKAGLTPKQIAEYDRASKGMKLPKRVKPKKAKKKKAKIKSKK